ncbi:MAG: HAD hydrolase-like protein [Acidimicrobiales bacterium]|nr:HAD hydrolase-like protein [Acidimicrobiales bacterium]
MGAVDAVTFDYWNTLMLAEYARQGETRLTVMLRTLARHGLQADPDRIQASLREAARQFDAHWRRNEVYRASDAIDQVLRDQDLRVPAGVHSELTAIITDPDPEHDPEPTPNIGEALETLKSAGVRIGIICDVGLAPSTTLRRILAGHGLLGYFDHWSFSDDVGTFKPDPVIFEHALSGLGGIDPSRAAHVGDLRRTDVAGANALGITSVRYTGAFDDPGRPEDGSDAVEARHVVADHADLPAALGVD